MTDAGETRDRAEAPAAGPERGSAVYLAGVYLVASLGGLLFGFDTAVISGTSEFLEEQFDLVKFQVGWFGRHAKEQRT